jgi:hypothetical protein
MTVDLSSIARIREGTDVADGSLYLETFMNDIFIPSGFKKLYANIQTKGGLKAFREFETRASDGTTRYWVQLVPSTTGVAAIVTVSH